MKIINYEKLFSEFKPDGAISEDANEIANTLIRELFIQSGTGLVRLLGMKPCFDNHMAIRVWVQKRLDANSGYIVDEMFSQLESELYVLLPQTIYGY
ncbi:MULTISPECIES: hypothetical protein [Psychrobacter]|jgi:hypothetical protein|uniref:Uncharacterized protein n=2 Tax=Psychrobacter TaxID=497 RepID=A0A1G6VIL1_9GAMM|nr:MULTISPECIES: hypothetical protein [Psychrobacter]MDH4905364.1 hypothetical protein [Psychrobacter pocilloporae]GLR28489.1 hypothetical protein GCM10007915_07270 [Psychrobacter pacificensis]SDD52877.1 hypothetical protein SAMN05660405_00581 [Psychrobacter pacificensis]|tara:strand:- start:275 stop:565 length:291 start_codon:yes stop_codon:yes gene_type:complete